MRARLLIIIVLIATGLLVGLWFYYSPLLGDPIVASTGIGGGEGFNYWVISYRIDWTKQIVTLILTAMMLYLGGAFCARMFELKRLQMRVLDHFQQGHWPVAPADAGC
jgi:hypothetical protein